MTTVIKHRDFANVKRTAELVQPLVTKKNALAKKIQELYDQYNATKDAIERHQSWVKEISGGYTTEELVVRRTNDEGKFIAGYEPNTNLVRFDEEKRVYVIEIPDAPYGAMPQETEEPAVEEAPENVPTEQEQEAMEAVAEQKANDFDPNNL